MIIQYARTVTILLFIAVLASCSRRERHGLSSAELVRGTADAGGAVPVEVYTVATDTTMQSSAVVLQDKLREKMLPIFIGPCEAQAIASRLNGIRPFRPMTHDLMSNILEKLKIEVKHVVVNDFDESTYYARIVLVNNGSSYEIDARPSDAIALAVRMSIPIYVAQKVMEHNAVGPGVEPRQDRPSPGKKIHVSPGKKI